MCLIDFPLRLHSDQKATPKEWLFLWAQMRTRPQIWANKKRQHRLVMKLFDPLHVSSRGKRS